MATVEAEDMSEYDVSSQWELDSINQTVDGCQVVKLIPQNLKKLLVSQDEPQYDHQDSQ